MKTTRLGALLIFGFGLAHICSLTLPAAPCLSAVELCMSDLCLAKTTGGFCKENGLLRINLNWIALLGRLLQCNNRPIASSRIHTHRDNEPIGQGHKIFLAERCQMKEWVVCNRSLPSVLELFPSLRACVCEQDTHMCGSIPALLAQCHQKPAAQRQRSSENDWQSSTLLDLVDDTSRSCLESIRLCLSDAVCNRRLAPVLQECMKPNCEHDRCQQATASFFQAMPPGVARMMVMCQCQDSDEACRRMSSALHSGTCGSDRTVCLHSVTQCARDRRCRRRLSVFQSRCWSSVEPYCLTDPHSEECLSQMNPTLILGAQAECQTAFLDTLSTALHYPCTCEGLLGPDLQTCAMIYEVFHNRTHFIKQRKDSKAPTTNPPDQSEDVLFDLSDYLLSGFACLLLTGVTVLAITIILWLARRKKENKLHSFQKSHTVIL